MQRSRDRRFLRANIRRTLQRPVPREGTERLEQFPVKREILTTRKQPIRTLGGKESKSG